MDELKRAYRKAAREWHPDRNPSAEAEARFKEVSAAWEMVSDPSRRRRHRMVHNRAARGELSEEFLLDVADAIERAETWARDFVLPHYAQYSRGLGAEMATRLFRDLDQLRTPGHLEPAGWLRRRRVDAIARRLVVTVRMGWSADLSVVRRGRKLTEIVLFPSALWRAGFRDSASLDDAVMQLLLARFAQCVGPARAPASGGDWDAAVAEARAADQASLFQQGLVWAFWAAVGLLIAVIAVGAARSG